MDNLKLQIYKSIENRLTGHGFKYVKSKDWFVRKRDYGKDYYLVTVIDDTEIGNGYLVSPAASVRIDQIEQIFNSTSGVPSQYHGDSFTLGYDFWRKYGSDGLRFHVDITTKLQGISDDLLSVFHKYALPFYDEHCTVEQVDRMLNTNPYEPVDVERSIWYRCSKGIIASKLTGRLSHNNLKQMYREQVVNYANGFYLPQFDALLASLDVLA